MINIIKSNMVGIADTLPVCYFEFEIDGSTPPTKHID